MGKTRKTADGGNVHIAIGSASRVRARNKKAESIDEAGAAHQFRIFFRCEDILYPDAIGEWNKIKFQHSGVANRSAAYQGRKIRISSAKAVGASECRVVGTRCIIHAAGGQQHP